MKWVNCTAINAETYILGMILNTSLISIKFLVSCCNNLVLYIQLTIVAETAFRNSQFLPCLRNSHFFKFRYLSKNNIFSKNNDGACLHVYNTQSN